MIRSSIDGDESIDVEIIDHRSIDVWLQ